MSIELTNPITETDLVGNETEISNVKVSRVQFDGAGNVSVDYVDSVTGVAVETVSFTALSSVNNIIGQIDTYVTAQGIVDGTKD